MYSVSYDFRSENGALLRDGGGKKKGTLGEPFSDSESKSNIRKWETINRNGAGESDLCKVVK